MSLTHTVLNILLERRNNQLDFGCDSERFCEETSAQKFCCETITSFLIVRESCFLFFLFLRKRGHIFNTQPRQVQTFTAQAFQWERRAGLLITFNADWKAAGNSTGLLTLRGTKTKIKRVCVKSPCGLKVNIYLYYL